MQLEILTGSYQPAHQGEGGGGLPNRVINLMRFVELTGPYDHKWIVSSQLSLMGQHLAMDKNSLRPQGHLC